MQTLLYNATLVLPDRLVDGGWLLVEDDIILDLGEASTCPKDYMRGLNGNGNLLLPGLIDLHCDAIEKLVEPRPEVHFDIHTALQEADLRLAGSGITTEFHAVSLDDNEFGVRSDSFMHEMRQAIEEQRAESLVRHKIHARLELSSERGSRIITHLIERRECELVSLMDHSPGQGQYTDVKTFRDYIARVTSKSEEEIEALVEKKRVEIVNIPARIERIARLAREAGLALATHDDDTASRVERWPALGVRISEFPTTLAAAQRAHELGLAVCMGAPNVLRGKSSGGNLSALTAIRANSADVLCSDYYPAAMLGAVFVLERQHVLPLPHAVRLVTLNPARAVGMESAYGSLAAGKVADLVLVKRMQRDRPRVLWMFVGGEERVRLGNA